MKKIAFFLLIVLTSFSLSAEVTFDSPLFGQDDNLLFTADLDVPGYGRYSTLFDVELGEKQLRQLTVFPEEAVMLDGGRTLQIRNRYGLFRTQENFRELKMISSFPGFTEGKQIKTGKMFASHPSPDGKYLAYLNPISYGYGDLVVYNVQSGKETLISRNLDLSYSDEVVLWSPDSDFLIYSKNANVYYYSIDSTRQKMTLSEDFRLIGKGLISNIRWSAGKELFYLSDSIIYRIISAQLFTTSLYGELMEIGEVAGKIPFDFNPAFDSFHVSPDGEKIIFNKAGSNIFLYYLKNSDYVSTGDVVSLPYLYLPRNTRLKKVVWPTNDVVTILTDSIEGGEQKTSVFRFDLRYTDKPLEFKRIPETNVIDIEPSLNSDSAAVLYPDRIVIKEYRTWSTAESFKFDSPLKAFWISDSKLLVAGEYSTEIYDIITQESRVLAVSQADSSGFTKSGGIYSSTADNLFVKEKNSTWERVSSIDEAAALSISDNYRAYTQPISSGPYANMIMLRKLDSFGTEPLFPYPETLYEPFPVRDEDVDFTNFSHGSRIRRREISLVFNAVYSAEGLTEVLNILDDYNVRATFFINGNFMKHNPEAVTELSMSSHEIGSLFYAYFNMTDSKYRLDTEFIKRGLARNEDDYYALTGKELALLWHAPYYVVNTDIIRASKEMNYTYINRDVDPLEWALNMGSYGGAGLSVPEMVEKIMRSKQPGSIIPIRLGEVKDGAGTLYSNLDLLLNNLIEKGYSVVPVSVLIDRARG